MKRTYDAERYIPWYRHPTPTWLELSATARGVLVSVAMELNDATGSLFLRRGLSSLATMLRIPLAELEPALAELLEVGKLRWDHGTQTLSDPEYLARKRPTSSERVRKHRERSGNACNVTSVSSPSETPCNDETVSSSLLSSSLISLEEEEPKQEGSQARYAEAYAAGITRGKGSPYVWPGTKYAQWDLGKIISGHAKDSKGKAYRGDQLLRYLEHTAGEFAADVTRAGSAKFYFAFDPRGCLKWLNEDAKAEEARRVG